MLAQEAIEQGKYYYQHNDHAYREQMMVENFIREFDNLSGENIMGIYGAAHTGLDAMISSVPTMATQLKERYGDALHLENLIEPDWIDTIVVAGKKYEAAYFGQENVAQLSDTYIYRDFWRLENAYDDFKHKPKTGTKLLYINYPILVEIEQVFVVDYTKTDGSVERLYFRSDGLVWNGFSSTEEFTID